MKKNQLAKVMKYEIRYLDGCADFHAMQENVWLLQRQTREILNRTIQIAYHWDYTSYEHFKKTGEYLDIASETGYKRLDGYIYDCLKGDYADMSAANMNATIQKAWSKYTTSKSEVLRGNMSIPSYKKDQPLVIHKDSVRLSESDHQTVVNITLFSNKFKSRTAIPSNIRFSMLVKDKTQRTILDRVLSGEYGTGQCQLVYDRPKWFLLLTYTFSPEKLELDEDKILGVDLGEHYALCASIYGENGRLTIEGGEITAFAKKWEARKHSMQKQAAICGEGRKGHGTKTRVSNVYQVKDRIENFRETTNHRYSRALIEYAVKNQCGIIQMEDLTGIKETTGFPKFLKHWSYYDLQTKIAAKAKENGISVIKVNPQYTSQRCSKCGNIDKDNRKTQERFCCVKCGYTENADFNASQNIALKNINQIIQKEIGAKVEQTSSM